VQISDDLVPKHPKEVRPLKTATTHASAEETDVVVGELRYLLPTRTLNSGCFSTKFFATGQITSTRKEFSLAY
jgi:hypothetical protein